MTRSGSAKKRPPRRATGNKDDTKLILLAATADLPRERPNLEFTLAEVGARARLSAALVQSHFGSKLGLLHALLEASSMNYVRQINGLIEMEMSAIDKLPLRVRAIVVTYAKTPYLDWLLHLLIDSSDEEEARRISDFYVRRVVDFSGRLIEQGVREGVFRPIDPMHRYFNLPGTAPRYFSVARYWIIAARSSAVGTAWYIWVPGAMAAGFCSHLSIFSGVH